MSQVVSLIHGWGMNASCWDSLCAVNPGYTLNTIELPGHGKRSNEELPSSLNTLAEDLLTRTAPESIWCGWSLGAQVALRAAVLAPARVQALILVSPTPRFVASTDWTHGMPPASFENFYQAVKANPVASLKRFSLLMFEGAKDAKERGRDYFRKLQKYSLPSAENLCRGLDILGETDLRSELAEIKQPVYLLAGEQDSICPVAAARWMQQALDWPLVEVEEGHAPQLSYPETILDMIAELEQELSLV